MEELKMIMFDEWVETAEEYFEKVMRLFIKEAHKC
jgi:hypothetical protein